MLEQGPVDDILYIEPSRPCINVYVFTILLFHQKSSDNDKVNYDAEGQNINYNDAVLRIKDVPVFYTPFLSHPAPEVKRRSGLLMSSFGTSSYLGRYIQPVYFWDISDQTDLILSPYFTSDRDVVLNGQYRHYFYKGEINAEGSFLKDDGHYKNKKYQKK